MMLAYSADDLLAAGIGIWVVLHPAPVRAHVRLPSREPKAVGVLPLGPFPSIASLTRPAAHSDRHPVTVEFMVLVISALTGAKVGEVMDELDRRDPLYHLEAKFIFAA